MVFEKPDRPSPPRSRRERVAHLVDVDDDQYALKVAADGVDGLEKALAAVGILAVKALTKDECL